MFQKDRQGGGLDEQLGEGSLLVFLRLTGEVVPVNVAFSQGQK